MIASIEHITSLSHPELEPYHTLRRPVEHLQQGIFVAESGKVVARLLASSIQPISMLLSDDWYQQFLPMIEANSSPIKIFVGEKALLESIVGHRLHQSIMAVGKIPQKIRPTDMLRSSAENALYVMADGITNSENMGVIVRNCVCFNADALLVLPSSCDPYLRRSVRNSMGNIFQLPIVYLEDGDADIRRIRSSGIRLYAAHPQPESMPVGSVRFGARTCIVVGAEGNGISAQLLDLCDEYVTIPMKEGVDSLNVASATAVMLWEAMKQQRGTT